MREVLDRCDALSLEMARESAERWLVDIRTKGDPVINRQISATAKLREGLTVKEVLRRYLEARQLRERSTEFYTDLVHRNLSDWLQRPISSITPREVVVKRDVIRARVVSARSEPRRGTACAGVRATGERTANAALKTFRSLFQFAARHDLIQEGARNPVRLERAEWFNEPRRETRIPDEKLSQFSEGLNALTSPATVSLITLILRTGLRANEAAGLRWDEVDLNEGYIRLPASRTKANRTFVLPLSEQVRRLLGNQFETRGCDVYVFAGRTRGTAAVPPKATLRRLSERIGLRVGAHDLRRTFVSIALNSGVNPYSVKRLVNHSLKGDVTAGYHVQDAAAMNRLRNDAARVNWRLDAASNNLLPFALANAAPTEETC